MDTTAVGPLRDALRAATDAAGMGRLLRRLGVCGRLSEADAASRAACGFAGAAEVARVYAGEPSAGIRVVVCLTGTQPDPLLVARLTRLAAAADPLRPGLLVTAGPGCDVLVFSTRGLDGAVRQLSVDRRDVRASDLDALRELSANGHRGVALAVRLSRALDRSRVTRRFFRDIRARRGVVAAAWTGVPAGAGKERSQLALLLLSRLMFLYFVQRRGHLAGDPAYLPGLFGSWAGEKDSASFYRARLEPLFFEALNTRPESRADRARVLGDLPFLNGGLFERTALERRFPELDLPDDAVRGIFDGLLERYRFTVADASRQAVTGAGEGGVDPEMLGRVFEGLMSSRRRGATGTFYTPAAVVDRVVSATLSAYLGERCGLEPPQAQRLVTGAALAGLPAAVPGAGDTLVGGDAAGEAEDGDAAAGDVPRSAAVPGIAAGDHRTAGAIAELRILDPACGSGAFLLGVLERLARLRRLVDPNGADAAGCRRQIVARSLFGVDIQEDAALLCALRLWLALAEPGGDSSNQVAPLPNLDRRIRQGDALVDPLDLLRVGAAAASSPWARGAMDASIRRHARVIAELAAEYLEAEPDGRQAIRARLARAETRLAAAWLDGIERRLLHVAGEAREQATSRDLFGGPSEGAARAAAALREAQAQLTELNRIRDALRERGALPFFSFDIHFADAPGGFDVIVSNPPWIRAHSWPSHLRRLVRDRFEVCGQLRVAGAAGSGASARRSGVLYGGGADGGVGGTKAARGGQVDVAMLFLERSIRLLARPGALGMLLPAKFLRSISAGPARAMLLREMRIVSLEDHGLDHRAIFRVDAFAAALVAIKPGAARAEHESGIAGGSQAEAGGAAGGGRAGGGVKGGSRSFAPVRITMTRRGVAPLRFGVRACDLSLRRGDPSAPWLLAPPDAAAALRRMQSAGVPLGALPGVRVRRGVMTGANDVLIIREASAKLGGLAVIRAEGYQRGARAGRSRTAVRRFAGVVEAEALCPLVRGSGIDAWSYRSDRHVVWRHDTATLAPVPPPPRMAAYLARHAKVLGGGHRTGVLGRLSLGALRPKVAWQDLSETVNAVALPARIRTLGREAPLLPLNTVYFIPVVTDDDARVLAGWLNSMPLRTFARAIAERAKDARFRFFAWTVASLPLPADWRGGRVADEVRRISTLAHERGGILREEQERLDGAVATTYGLTPEETRALRRFDAWLRGVSA